MRAAPEAVLRGARLLKAEPVGWTRAMRGYTAAERWVVRFADGSSAFFKAATNERTAETLRAEHHVYASLEAAFMARMLGWEDGDLPLIALEDLSYAHWPPPWSERQVGRALELLAEIAATPPPPGLPGVEELVPRDGWAAVARDPEPFLSLGLADAAWLDRVLPTLVVAEAAAPMRGSHLLHTDVRSDNLCFPEDGIRVVDWNWACLGSPKLDLAAFLPSLAAEGGPPPDALLKGEAELAALLSGYFAARAGLPPPSPGSRVREIALVQLTTSLPWAARELGLPEPSPQS
jgi:aminoglycoside phosphotransferase (APT) family kinase protein